MLVGRQRLARQHRLLNGEVSRFDQPSVSRHQIAGGKPKHVTGHHRAEGHLPPAPVAEKRGGRRDGGVQPVGRLLRLIRLPEVDRDAQQDDRHDDRRIDTLAERRGNRARDEEDDDERIREQVPELREGGEAAPWDRLIRSTLLEPLPRLAARQTGQIVTHRGLGRSSYSRRRHTD